MIGKATRFLAKRILPVLLALCLTACGLGSEPSKQLVRNAIALQVNQTQQELVQQLASYGRSADKPLALSRDFSLGGVKITQRDRLTVAGLPTYRVRGTYNLTLSLPKRSIKQPQNEFEVYLQRQQEGKTWRVLRPEASRVGSSDRAEIVWRSYSLGLD